MLFQYLYHTHWIDNNLAFYINISLLLVRNQNGGSGKRILTHLLLFLETSTPASWSSQPLTPQNIIISWISSWVRWLFISSIIHGTIKLSNHYKKNLCFSILFKNFRKRKAVFTSRSTRNGKIGLHQRFAEPKAGPRQICLRHALFYKQHISNNHPGYHYEQTRQKEKR